MQKTILITGSTDGIGLETAKALASQGHNVLLHGRSADKLEAARKVVTAVAGSSDVSTYMADLSKLSEVLDLANSVIADHSRIDVLINNAGIFKTANPTTEAGLDVRFMVNTIAPYLLTQKLLSVMSPEGRIVNLSSAAQAPVKVEALTEPMVFRDDFTAYAQSKLAITMWTKTLAERLGKTGPVVVAVNPGSLLGTKMVKDGFGTSGNDIGIGVDILSRAALSEEFADRSGQYFDNDSKRFSPAHPDASDPGKCMAVMDAVETAIERLA